MILTTPTKHSFTTTKHNHKGYIFTLYLFMLLCVVGNCLLYYCSCTGNCENCCGINGLLRIANIDQDGKVDGNNILNGAFINGENKASVNVSIYRGSTEKDYNDAKKEFMDKIDTTCETHLSAYVEVGDTARYFIYCKDANSKHVDNSYYGLFDGSAATKIVVLQCGSKIENMRAMFLGCSSLTSLDLSNFNTNNVTNMQDMFQNCSSLTILDLSNFNTGNVTNMFWMFGGCNSLTNLDLSNWDTHNVTNMDLMFNNCSSLTELDLSSFNTIKVTNMRGMFYNCSSLTNLDLSKFNTNKVTNMSGMFRNSRSLTNITFPDNFITNNVIDMMNMFKNCFKEKQISTLICKASTLKKITENEKSCLIITNKNEKNNKINDILNKDNKGKVCKCSVKRVGNNPEITEVEEYQPQQ